MFRKAITAALCSLLAAAALSSCGEKNISVSENASQTTEASTSAASDSSEVVNVEVMNFTAPADGEEVIVLTVKDYGDIRIKLFPEYAEKGVENFKTLAEQGYYNGIIFHRIINNFMIQGGDPTGTGRGGESIYGAKFDGGVDPHLIHVGGAVAYANSGSTATDGSQFYIVTGQTFTEEQFAPSYPSFSKEAYLKAGGYPWLDGGYTVFGQVFDGLDIVYKLQQVPTDANDKPLTDVVIESMKVEKYDGRAMKWYISDYIAAEEPSSEDASEDETSSEGETEAAGQTGTEDATEPEGETQSEEDTSKASSEAQAQ